MTRSRDLLAALCALAVAGPAGAQAAAVPHAPFAPARCPRAAPDADARRFLDEARARTARYQDPEVARADGYRPIGPDMPGMGRHWVHVGLVAADSLEAARPALLTYAVVDGREVLVGLAYARPLAPRESPPARPAPAPCWHLHAGDVDEEALAAHQDVLHDALPDAPHPAHAPAHAPADGRRAAVRVAGVAMVHVWLWSENPDGLFAAHNWSLPWRRAGLPAPAAPTPAAAQGLALADGGDAYVSPLLRRALADVPGGERALAELRPVVDAHAARARTAAAALRARGGVTPEDERALAALWASLWDALERAAGDAAAAAAVRAVRARLPA